MGENVNVWFVVGRAGNEIVIKVFRDESFLFWLYENEEKRFEILHEQLVLLKDCKNISWSDDGEEMLFVSEMEEIKLKLVEHDLMRLVTFWEMV